jgi:hypothetical protein
MEITKRKFVEGSEINYIYRNRDITWEFDLPRSLSLKTPRRRTLEMSAEKDGKLIVLSGSSQIKNLNLLNNPALKSGELIQKIKCES